MAEPGLTPAGHIIYDNQNIIINWIDIELFPC